MLNIHMQEELEKKYYDEAILELGTDRSGVNKPLPVKDDFKFVNYNFVGYVATKMIWPDRGDIWVFLTDSCPDNAQIMNQITKYQQKRNNY